jgi:hypothetical protein
MATVTGLSRARRCPCCAWGNSSETTAGLEQRVLSSDGVTRLLALPCDGRCTSAVDSCACCGRSRAPKSAVTALRGDPKEVSSWRREVLPLRGRCHRALAAAGSEGRRVKAARERWWLAHGNAHHDPLLNGIVWTLVLSD